VHKLNRRRSYKTQSVRLTVLCNAVWSTRFFTARNRIQRTCRANNKNRQRACLVVDCVRLPLANTDILGLQEREGSRWLRGLRRGSAAALLLRLGVRTRRRHACLSLVSVVRCQVEVSATDRSLAHRIPTKCVSMRVITCNNNPLHLQRVGRKR
jgi:hypothetical protein